MEALKAGPGQLIRRVASIIPLLMWSRAPGYQSEVRLLRTNERSHLLDQLKRVLESLRATVSDRADQAYADRDDEGASGEAQMYAAGEAHAYSVAEDDVREAQRDEDSPA